MASKRAIERSARAFSMKDADVSALADKLFASKRRVYRRTLLELQTQLGVIEPKRPMLSPEIEEQLRRDSERSARDIAHTFNDELAAAVVKIGAAAPDEKLRELTQTWVNARQRARAQTTAITETYPAYTDALISGFRDLGVAPTFRFGGHPELGDEPPACEICVTLERLSPWPMEKVAEIGNPHPACRQRWHIEGVELRDLPTDFQLGQTPGGSLLQNTLVQRNGNDRGKAVAELEALAER